MGHAIDYGFLDAKTEKKAMKEGLKKAEEFAYWNVDEQENPSRSYHGNFRFYDYMFNSEEEALDFFHQGFYKDGVCRVKVLSESKQKKYFEKIKNTEIAKSDYWNSLLDNFKNRKSATVGCKKCGKRFPKDIIRNLSCPSCHTRLITPSQKEKLEKYDKKLQKIKEEELRETKEKGKPKFFYKVEVHC